ncbi:hypothetical protein WR25_20044 [Diploscapter pachys]|uniref:Core Histone H2A/H2B/H3 domain-containing protein n=1 Tax=Diploscapter pachys TaxID=2018661 RepID=A0A2A2L4T7_9BILA|nr:hypothetical protein WR25_20044 [Diploscapter pachys]
MDEIPRQSSRSSTLVLPDQNLSASSILQQTRGNGYVLKETTTHTTRTREVHVNGCLNLRTNFARPNRQPLADLQSNVGPSSRWGDSNRFSHSVSSSALTTDDYTLMLEAEKQRARANAVAVDSSSAIHDFDRIPASSSRMYNPASDVFPTRRQQQDDQQRTQPRMVELEEVESSDDERSESDGSSGGEEEGEEGGRENGNDSDDDDIPQHNHQYSRQGNLSSTSTSAHNYTGGGSTKQRTVIPPPKHKQKSGKLQKTNRRVLKQPKRYAPGAKALKEIRDLQKSTKLLVPKVPFARVVRQVMQELGKEDYRIQALAIEALQEGCEAKMVELFEMGCHAMSHAKRATLFPSDIQLVRRIRNE